MKKIKLYRIQENTKDYSCFLQTNYKNYYESIKYKALHEQKWKPFNLDNYIISEFELEPSDTGKKIFNMTYLQIPAPNAADASKDILESMGEFSPIKIPNKIEKL